MAIEVLVIPPGERLHSERAHCLTASDVPAAIGLSPFKSRLTLYAEKAGLIGQQPDNESMKRGRWLESAAITGMREQFPGRRIIQPNVFVRDPDIRLGCTPDALTEDPETGGLVNLQIKCTSPSAHAKWNDVVPDYYQVQVATENLLLDTAYGTLCVLIVDGYSARLEYYDIPRHPKAEAQIREIANVFWRNIANGVMPDPDYDRDAETISALFPKPIPGPTLDLSADNMLPAILRERAMLKAAMTAEQARLDAIEAEIKRKLGTADTAELPGWHITWKQQSRKEHIVAASTFRRLLVTENDAA